MAEDGLRWVNYMSTFSILVIPCQHLSPRVCFGSNAPRNAKQPHCLIIPSMRAIDGKQHLFWAAHHGWMKNMEKNLETMYIAEDRV